MSDLAAAVIDTARHRIVVDFPSRVRACLDVLTDDEVWWRPNAKSNSVGNLVLHLCGSTRHFLGRGVGGSDFQRDRPAEFAETGPIPREALLRTLDETVAEAERVFAGVTPERLLEGTDRAGDSFTVVSLLFRMSHHWAEHTGQIVYVTKALKEGVFSELWKRTLR